MQGCVGCCQYFGFYTEGYMQKSDMICLMLYKDRSLLEQMVRSKNGNGETDAGRETTKGLYWGANDRDDDN